jgi:hypothetical protein
VIELRLGEYTVAIEITKDGELIKTVIVFVYDEGDDLFRLEACLGDSPVVWRVVR